MPRVGSRRWIAWKLVQLAHRVYDAEYYEQITITGPDGEDLVEFVINADLYGGGVSMMTGHENFGEGYGVHWTDDYVPDWLTGRDA
jgi:hypothetical protein